MNTWGPAPYLRPGLNDGFITDLLQKGVISYCSPRPVFLISQSRSPPSCLPPSFPETTPTPSTAAGIMWLRPSTTALGGRFGNPQTASLPHLLGVLFSQSRREGVAGPRQPSPDWALPLRQRRGRPGRGGGIHRAFDRPLPPLGAVLPSQLCSQGHPVPHAF